MRIWTIALAAAPLLLAGAAAAQQAPFVAEAGPDLWRASRLIGLDVLGPDGKKVGAVSDVLLDHEGRAVDVVIGVGGFLGVGQKDVALPYAQLRFADAARPIAPAPAAAAVGGPVGTTAGVPGGTVSGLASAPVPGAPGGPTAGVARPAPRPDPATVDLTADQLKAAPPFAFERRTP